MKFLFPVFFCYFFCIRGLAQQSCPSWGPYVSTNNFKGDSGVLMMADVMFPSDGIAPYTYASSINFKIGKSGGYCGIQQAGLNEERKGNNIFSIWDFPNKVQITASYKDHETFVGGFGGEGTGLHSHNDFGWVADHWYTNIVRSWSTNDSTTNVGYWLYDQTAGTWTHYVTFVVPEAHAMLKGNIGSFLENFADGTKRSRKGRYKGYWLLKSTGQWLHPDTLIASAGKGSWKATKIGEDGIELTSCGTEIGPDKYTFPVKMRDKPGIVKQPILYDLGAYYDKRNSTIHVDWSVTKNDMPQLSYSVAVYNNRDCIGYPLAKASGIDPEITMAALKIDKLELKERNYYVTVQITDIFNQVSEVKHTVLSDLKP